MLLLGLFLFITAHSLSFFASGTRARVVSVAGEMRWKRFVAVTSLAGLVLVYFGYTAAQATALQIFEPAPWARYLCLVLMVPVFPLLFATYLPGRIQRLAVHPMLTAVTLWSFAHLLANGTSPDVILFWSFFIWSVADRLGLKYRPAPAVPGAPPHRANDLIAIVLGLAVYGVMLFWAHAWLFGVGPLDVAAPTDEVVEVTTMDEAVVEPAAPTPPAPVSP